MIFNASQFIVLVFFYMDIRIEPQVDGCPADGSFDSNSSMWNFGRSNRRSFHGGYRPVGLIDRPMDFVF